MATLPITKLTTHPEGSLNLGGVINANWETLEEIMDPATADTSPVFGVLLNAMRGQGSPVVDHTYAASVDLDFTDPLLQRIVLTGDVTLTFSELGLSRGIVLLLEASGATRAITWPVGIKWSGDPLTSLDSGDKAMVLLHSFGTTDGDVWAGVPGGGGGGGGGGSFTWEGAWTTATAYEIDDLVENDGSTWICIADHTSGTDDDEPGVGANTSTYWDLFVAAGQDGADGDDGADGADGASGLAYQFNTATSGDPGSGKLLLNHATVASATAMNISETDGDGNAIAALLATFDDGTSTIRGRIEIRDPATPTNFAIFHVTGTITDNGSYDTLSITHVASGGTLTNNLPVHLLFVSKGDKGDTGAAGSDGAADVGTLLAILNLQFIP